MSKYEIAEQALRELHAEGLGNREIARRLEVPHWAIAKALKAQGLKTNVLRGVPPEAVDAEHSRCAKCGQVVKNEDFPFVQGRADGRRLSYCRKCRRDQLRQAVGRSPESYWQAKQNYLRNNRKGNTYELPAGYLAQRWSDQEGKCFYTDTPLVLSLGEGRSRNAPSVDRIDVSLGYIPGNVVICSNRVNTMKSDVTLEELRLWMPPWYSRVVELWRSLGLTCLQVAPGDF